MEKFEQPNLTIAEAVNEIKIITQRVMQMGANDFEPSVLAQLINRVLAGDITPMAGVAEARAIEMGKNDYH